MTTSFIKPIIKAEDIVSNNIYQRTHCLIFLTTDKNALTKYFFYLLSILLFFGCQKIIKEDPYFVAKDYCICATEKLKSIKDSSVDINACEDEAFSKSRMMDIEAIFDRDPFITSKRYSSETLDSAHKFYFSVIRIIDTMCFVKFDNKRIRKKPHIKM